MVRHKGVAQYLRESDRKWYANFEVKKFQVLHVGTDIEVDNERKSDQNSTQGW